MLDMYITIILITLALIFKRSKFICVLIFIFMFTLAGWNTWNGDYDAYERLYYNSILMTNEYEPGYILINNVSNMLGIKYQFFLQIIYGFVLSIFAYASIKYSKYPALYSAIYFMIFILEYVFLRNYLSHAILLVAFIVVIKEVRLYKLWFFVLVMIASTMHSTAIIWLLFFFAIKQDEKILNLKKSMLFFSTLAIGSYFFLIPILSVLGGSYSDKIQAYLYEDSLTTVFFIHPLIVFLVYNYFKIVLNREVVPRNFRKIYCLVANVNIISLVYLSLYIHIPYFARFLRFLFAFDILFMISAFYYIKTKRSEMNMTLTLCLIIFALIVMFYGSTHHFATYPLFKNNSLWGDESYVPSIYYE